MGLLKNIELETGAKCNLYAIKNDLIPNYFLLSYPKKQGEPSEVEVNEMLRQGIVFARELSLKFLKDPEAFSVLYSGYSSRREKGWHVHIVLLGSRWKKARLYFVLALKNLLQAFKLRKDDAPKI